MPSIQKQQDSKQAQQQQQQQNGNMIAMKPVQKNINSIQQQTNRNQPLNKNEINDKNRIMTHEKVRRGDLYGPIFDVEHLATFTVGSKQGLLKAEDGMRKLRIMEKSHGIWTMECQLILDSNYLGVLDKKTGQEVELFPLSLVHDPTSVVSDDKKDVYNNILLFTVLEDNKKKSSTSTPSEMHVFQCVKLHSAEIVDEIYRIKEGSNQPVNSKQHIPNTSDSNDPNNILANKITAANLAASAKLSPLNSRLFQQNEMLTPSKIELEVQILNHCFDDIERFVTRLQNSTEFFKELERRQKQRKSHKKSIGDGMLGLRAQMPPPQHFVDIFQKFKLSFNLLAKLKAHIHDPNAPELIHFLFTPLTLIFNTTKDHPYRGLSKTVWTPMITKEAKELLLNCLTSREQDLWLLLGESWSITSDEAKHQPHLYGIYDNQIYNPVFYDGWSPSLSLEAASEQNEMSRLAFATAAQVQAQSHLIQNQPQLPLQKQRFYSNTQPQFNDEPLTGKQQLQAASKFNSSSNNQFNDQRQIIQGLLNGQIGPTDLQNNNNNNINRQINIPNYDKMKKWAIDLCYRGVKVYEVTHDRQANNDKELTIKTGELLEVLDDKKNWWRLRNYNGQIGHAPVTILRQFEFSSDSNNNNQNIISNNNNNNNLVGQYDPEKSYDYEQTTTTTTTSTNHNKISKIINHTMSLQSKDLSRSSSSSSSAFSALNDSNKTNDVTYNVYSSKLLNNNNNQGINSKTFLIDNNQNKLDSIKLKRDLLKDDKSESSIDNSYEAVSNQNNNYSSSSGHFSFSLSGNSDKFKQHTKSLETLQTTPKSANSLKNKDTITNIKSVNVIFDSNESNPRMYKFESKQNNYNYDDYNNDETTQLDEIEPMKEMLHEELVRRMSKDRLNSREIKKTDTSYITNKSNSIEVKNFLILKEFPPKVILMFGELNGAQLFTLNRSDFEKFCGKELGIRLDSQITIQKRLCQYKEPSNELDVILKKRKEKSEK